MALCPLQIKNDEKFVALMINDKYKNAIKVYVNTHSPYAIHQSSFFIAAAAALFGVDKGTRTLDPRNHNPML